MIKKRGNNFKYLLPNIGIFKYIKQTLIDLRGKIVIYITGERRQHLTLSIGEIIQTENEQRNSNMTSYPKPNRPKKHLQNIPFNS